MEESCTPPMLQLCPSDASDAAFWSSLNVATPTCLPSPVTSRHANPSFFNSTPPPVTPSRRFAFVQEEWDACGGGDDEDDGTIGLQLESPDDDCAMPWSKANSQNSFLSRGAVFSSFAHAVEAACSPEDMSCATTADGASDGCNACDSYEWSSLQSGFIPPQRGAAALSPPLPSVAESEPVFVTRSGRKVKPKKLSLSPPLRPALAPASPSLLPLAHAISKKSRRSSRS